MADGIKNSRLAEIFLAQQKAGRGTLGALAGTIGGRAREKLDIRNVLFGPSYKKPTSLAQSIGRSIFGTGYSAAPRRGLEREMGAPLETSQKTVEVLSAVRTSLSSIDNKMTILAKNSIQQNKVARDVNVIRQNVIRLTKNATGKAATSADMFFMRAKQRESEYEKQFKEKRETIGEKSTDKGSTTGSEKSSLFGKTLKTGASFAAIYAIFQSLETIVNSIQKAFENFKPESIKSSIENFRKNFSFADILESISKGYASVMKFLKDGVNKIPSEKIGEFITFMTNNFLETFKFAAETFWRGFQTLSPEQMGIAAGASAIYGLLFGGGPLGIGIVGVLLKKVFKAVATTIAANQIGKSIGGVISGTLGGSMKGMASCCCDAAGVNTSGSGDKKGRKGSKGSSRGGRLGSLGDKAKKATKTLKGALSKVPKGLKGGLGGLLASVGLEVAANSARESGQEDLADGIDDVNTVLSAASAGAMIGSIVPGVGTAVGAAVGTAVGAGSAIFDRLSEMDPVNTRGRGAPGKSAGDSGELSQWEKDFDARMERKNALARRQAAANAVGGAGSNVRRTGGGGITGSGTAQKVNSTGGAEELTQWEKDFDARMERKNAQAQRVPAGTLPLSSAVGGQVQQVSGSSVNLPTNLDFDAYKNKVGYFESRGNYAQPPNKFGYVGKYQFGAQALETLGYLKSGSYSRFKNKALLDPNNWKNGLSLETFLNSPGLQDEAFAKLTKNNFDTLKSKGVVNENMTSDQLSGWLYVAHGVGAGGAIKFSQGQNPSEGFGTTASQMFAKASGQVPTMPAGGIGGTGASPSYSASLPKMTGDMFTSPFGNEMKAFGDNIVNVINNTMAKGEQAASEALTSVDMDSIKDMFNPMIARATYGFTL